MGIIVTYKLAKGIRLVVLTAKTYDKDSSGIGMKDHVAQYLTGILMVVTQLRASVVMRERYNGVNPLAICFLAKLFGQLVCYSVHATHRRDNPYLITYAGFSVGTQISFECTVLVRKSLFLELRSVSICTQTGKVSLNSFLVQQMSFPDFFHSVRYRETVFYHHITFCKILQGNLMTGRYILSQFYKIAVYLYYSTLGQWVQCHSHIVRRVYLDIFSHNKLTFIN